MYWHGPQKFQRNYFPIADRLKKLGMMESNVLSAQVTLQHIDSLEITQALSAWKQLR